EQVAVSHIPLVTAARGASAHTVALAPVIEPIASTSRCSCEYRPRTRCPSECGRWAQTQDISSQPQPPLAHGEMPRSVHSYTECRRRTPSFGCVATHVATRPLGSPAAGRRLEICRHRTIALHTAAIGCGSTERMSRRRLQYGRLTMD